jgi:hypothetical protein
MPDAIATYELVGRRGNTAPFPVRIAIYKPALSVAMSPAWACTVEVSPIAHKPLVIFGEGSFQALCLAARFAVQTLDTFLEQGGVLEYSNGESFDPSVFGFALLARQ